MIDKYISSFDVEDHSWTEEYVTDVDAEYSRTILGFKENGEFKGHIWYLYTGSVMGASSTYSQGLTLDGKTVDSGVSFSEDASYLDMRLLKDARGLLIEKDIFGRIVFCGMERDGVRHGPGTEFFLDSEGTIMTLGRQLWDMGRLAAAVIYVPDVGWRVIKPDDPGDSRSAAELVRVLEEWSVYSMPERALELFETAHALRERFGMETDSAKLEELRNAAGGHDPDQAREEEYAALLRELDKAVEGNDDVAADEAASRIITLLTPRHDPRALETAERLAEFSRELYEKRKKRGHLGVYEICMRCARLYEEYGDSSKIREWCKKAIGAEQERFEQGLQGYLKVEYAKNVLAALRLMARYGSPEERRAELNEATELCEALVRIYPRSGLSDMEGTRALLREIFKEYAQCLEECGDSEQAGQLRELAVNGEPRPAPVPEKPDYALLLPSFRVIKREERGKPIVTAGFFLEGKPVGLSLERKYFPDDDGYRGPGYDRSYVYCDPALMYDQRGITSDNFYRDRASALRVHEGASVELIEREKNTEEGRVVFCGMHFDGKRHGLGVEFSYDSEGVITKELCGLWQDGVLTHIYEGDHNGGKLTEVK